MTDNYEGFNIPPGVAVPPEVQGVVNQQPPPQQPQQPPQGFIPGQAVPQQQPTAPVQQPQFKQTGNPLLDKVKIPGETFQLPSLGIFYVNGELSDDVVDGEVHVHPMTAMDEILMRSPDKLLNGEAITDVLTRRVPQIRKPKELLSQDVDFLLVCLRKVSYGRELEFQYDHQCREEPKDHEYALNLDDIMRQVIQIDPATVEDVFVAELDNGQTVIFSPIKFKTIVRLLQLNSQSNPSPEKMEEAFIQTVVDAIVQVDDITDKKLIKQWIKAIPGGWLEKLNDKVDAASDWGVKYTFTGTCKECGDSIEVETPLNPIAFFSQR